MLEFSAPRVLLGSNAYVSAVRPWAALALVGRLCAELLPGTTSAGAAQGASWTVQRVDLAVDFAGFARGFLEAYRVMRTRRVRAAARGVWYGSRRPSLCPAEALMWAARRGGFAVVVYDKSAELLYRRRVEEGRRRDGAPALSELPPVLEPTVRVELRLRGRRALARLAAFLVPCEGLLFMLYKRVAIMLCSDGFRRLAIE